MLGALPGQMSCGKSSDLLNFKLLSEILIEINIFKNMSDKFC